MEDLGHHPGFHRNPRRAPRGREAHVPAQALTGSSPVTVLSNPRARAQTQAGRIPTRDLAPTQRTDLPRAYLLFLRPSAATPSAFLPLSFYFCSRRKMPTHQVCWWVILLLNNPHRPHPLPQRSLPPAASPTTPLPLGARPAFPHRPTWPSLRGGRGEQGLTVSWAGLGLPHQTLNLTLQIHHMTGVSALGSPSVKQRHQWSPGRVPRRV